MTLLEQFEDGDIRALSRIISHVENRSEGYQELLERLYPKAGRSLRVGITGPPGAGKSTLVNRLAGLFTRRDNKVGIIAVDPSSPFTGGALLGDRVRMNSGSDNIYFRSMATRGASGGLASSTDNVAIVMDAFGFDVIIIETVGVGQVELDIIDSCDAVAVVVVPESGDAVQTLKAGLLEIADIMVVNKADRMGADRIASDLKLTMHLRLKSKDDREVPVLLTEAINDKNIDLLYDAIAEHIDYIKANDLFEKNRRGRIKKKILNILKNRFQSEFISNLTEKIEFDQYLEQILNGETNPYRVGEELYRKFSGN